MSSATANIAIILGNVGNDPSTKMNNKGDPMTKFSVAVADGDNTLWFNVVTYGKTAENCSKYLSKGSQVFIEGRGRPWSNKSDDGVWKNGYDLVAYRVQFIGGRKDASDHPQKAPENPYGGAPSPKWGDDKGGDLYGGYRGDQSRGGSYDY